MGGHFGDHNLYVGRHGDHILLLVGHYGDHTQPVVQVGWENSSLLVVFEGTAKATQLD